MIKIKERHFLLNIFLLVIAIFLITSLVIGYDFSTNDPSNLGHTTNELKIKIDTNEYNLQTALLDGTIQTENNQFVSGRVVGGGIDGYYTGSACSPECSNWGGAICRGTGASAGANRCKVECPIGSTKRTTGEISYTCSGGGFITMPGTSTDICTKKVSICVTN